MNDAQLQNVASNRDLWISHIRLSDKMWSNFSSETNRSEEVTFVAGAAEQLALDDRHRHSRRGKAIGEGGPGLSSADDDRLVFLHDALR